MISYLLDSIVMRIFIHCLLKHETFKLRLFLLFERQLKDFYVFLEDKYVQSDDPVTMNLLNIKKKHKLQFSLSDLVESTPKLTGALDSSLGAYVIWHSISLFGANELKLDTLKKFKNKLNWEVLSSSRNFTTKELEIFDKFVRWDVILKYQKNLTADMLLKHECENIDELLKINKKLNRSIKMDYIRLKNFHKKLELL